MARCFFVFSHMVNAIGAKKRLIDDLSLPAGLKLLSDKELGTVADELRDELIDSVSESGGHFASSLGALELAVSLHRFFDTPRDKIVWDVGHQAYIHKMLTGRISRMSTIRKMGGLSGFLKREESEYDTFNAGHAGTSISAAVGMAVALARTDPGSKVIPVIGDASICTGMAFEALNHAGDLQLGNLIVVLNDNEMSISENVGALSRLLSSALTSETSTMLRRRVKQLYKGGYVPEILYKAVDRAEEVTQSFFSGASMLFEALGFRYIGPIDGNSIPSILSAFEHAKRQDTPVLIHARTRKGKGYEPAEQDPETWHGVIPFDRSKGVFHVVTGSKVRPTYTEVFGKTVTEIARADDRVIGITAAMASGSGLDTLQKELPKQFFDVGICEEHAVTFAAGLACQGFKPIVAVYSTFLQRAFDQIAHDVCLQNLPVIFAIDRAGLVGSDGETHHGILDITFLRSLPGITLMSPKDEAELRDMLYTAVEIKGPVAIRYPRGHGLGMNLSGPPRRIPVGKGEVLRKGSDALFICYGPVVKNALAATERLQAEHGVSVTVINSRFAKPMDEDLLVREMLKHDTICTIEDHSVCSGFGTAILELANKAGIAPAVPLKRFGVGDLPVPHATQEEQYQMCGMDFESIIHHVLRNRSAIRVVAAM